MRKELLVNRYGVDCKCPICEKMGSLNDEQKKLLEDIVKEISNVDTSRDLQTKVDNLESYYEKVKVQFGDFVLRYSVPEVFVMQ
jgi:hypothetical protein